ncbi:MAG TPA: hypothetical protein VGM41_20840, partial [Chitinophagaceae bacterium]
MKRIVTLAMALAIVVSSAFAASIVVNPSPATPAPSLKASAIMLPVAPGKFLSMQDLSTINVADYEKLSGQKMGWFKRMEFKIAQRKLRNSINEDGTLDNSKLAKMAGKQKDGETGFHLGGFALGFLLGLIGVLIAYLIND